MRKLDLTATTYRKLIATMWAETVSESREKEPLTKHTGHPASTARQFYDIEQEKMWNTAFTSHHIDQPIETNQPTPSAISPPPPTVENDNEEITSVADDLDDLSDDEVETSDKDTPLPSKEVIIFSAARDGRRDQTSKNTLES